LFPWQRLHEVGVGHLVEPAPDEEGPSLSLGMRGADVARLRNRFRQYGYGLSEADEFDVEMAAVVTAFQRHFRPEQVDGVLDRSTEMTLDRLLDGLSH
jgi:N-acetylmuramoyl-L-alanine amidase